MQVCLMGRNSEDDFIHPIDAAMQMVARLKRANTGRCPGKYQITRHELIELR